MSAPRIPGDQSDRDRIARDDLDRTLFVDAGAGTGKTTELVRRICNLVVLQGVAMQEIAAITFTEAAAAELQSRVRVELERRCRDSDDPEEVRRCTAALADADRAAITTLHGFASRILGEFAVAAELPPRITVLDELSSQLAAEERWTQFMDELYADGRYDELLVHAALLVVPLEPRFAQQPSLREVAAQLNQNWDLLGPFAAQPLVPLEPLDLRDLAPLVEDLETMMAGCTNPGDKLLGKMAETVLEARHLLSLPPDSQLQLLPGFAKACGHYNGYGKKGDWPDLDAARAARPVLANLADQASARVTQGVLHRLLVLTARFVLDGAAQRRTEGGLEFHDLLVIARDLLRHHDEARTALHQRFTHLLLDEFQDTDPIQIELALLIATGTAHPGSTAWAALDPPEGSVFFVGDPKQSIYRFRRADIELFLAARGRFGANGGLARLSTNFRTVEPVLHWVNALFGSLMPDEIPGQQPAYEPLEAFRPADSGADHRPVMLGGPHPDPKVKAGALREAEAADVAAIVAEMLAEPERWPVQDLRTKQWRTVAAADITILLPTRTSLPYLRKALEGELVPYRLATGTLVYDTQEVRDLVSTLRAIDDPSDELSLVAALRSPLYGCSDVDLYTYRRAGGRWDLRSAPPAALEVNHSVAAAYRHLRTMWEQRWWLTPSAMLTRLAQERNAFLLGFGAARPADIWKRLRFLIDQARAFEEAGGGGLRAFVDWAAMQGADGARVHEPLLPETDEAAVQIMTIHGAKGLEFPVTILSGMTTTKGGRRSGVSVLWDPTGLPHLALNSQLRTAQHQLRADLEAEMDEHEKLRLLYVAATRARDHLVVSCHHQAGKDGSYAERVWSFSSGAATSLARLRQNDRDLSVGPPDVTDMSVSSSGDEATAPGGGAGGAGGSPDAGSTSADHGAGVGAVAGADLPTSDAVFAAREGWVATRAALVEPFRQARTVSATGVAETVRAAHQADAHQADTGERIEPLPEQDDDHADADADAVDGPLVRRRGRAGTAVGQAVHATLQILDLARPVEVAAVVRQQCALESIEPLAETVERLVESALASEAVGLAARHRHHKELYVAAPFAQRMLEGYVDLLVETPEGLVVIDYKTDTVSSEAEVDAKLDRYELQAASYAVALETVTGQTVSECRFVFCRPAGAIERSVRDLRGAKARVIAVLSGEGVMPPIR